LQVGPYVGALAAAILYESTLKTRPDKVLPFSSPTCQETLEPIDLDSLIPQFSFNSTPFTSPKTFEVDHHEAANIQYPSSRI